jgi:competence protein ComEC
MLAGFWHYIPFVRIVIPMSIGIGINMFFPLALDINIICLSVCLLLLIVSWLITKQVIYNTLFGIFLHLSLYFMGVAIHNSHNHLNYSDHYSYQKSDRLLVEVIEPAQLRKNSVKCKLRVLKIYNGNISTDTEGLLLAYFKKDTSILSKIKYGTRLLIESNFKEIEAPKNPYEFNYKRYLGFNQVYKQIYLKENNYFIIDHEGGNVLWQLAYQAQSFFNVVLQQYIKDAGTIAILKALLYGYDDDIDPELIKAYSNTGTLHVLAVSGMHVGLIFWIINLVLRYFDKRQYQRMLKAIISIICIWAYSLLCGLSPSILRASVMFTFVAMGSSFKNKPNIYNTLAASAFALLLFDSNMLASVGFQLSFLAVFGIVSLQKYFKYWFSFNNWLMNEIWSITSVSIAAQIATFPLGLLYFHQFPVYFMASNLLIIPLTTIVIFLAIAMIILAALTGIIPFLSAATVAIAAITNFLIYITNYIVVFLEKLPFSFISGIHINELETILLFVIVAYFCNYFISKKQHLFKYALFGTLLFCSVHSYQNIKNYTQEFVCIYHIDKTFVMQIFQGNKSTLIADTSILHNADKFHFHLQQHIWACNIKQVDTIPYSAPISVKIKNTSFNIDKVLNNAAGINVFTLAPPESEINALPTNANVILSTKLKHKDAKRMTDLLNFKNIGVKNVRGNEAITLNLEF